MGRDERGQGLSFALCPGTGTVVHHRPQENMSNTDLQGHGHGAKRSLAWDVGREGLGSCEDPRGEQLNLVGK